MKKSVSKNKSTNVIDKSKKYSFAHYLSLKYENPTKFYYFLLIIIFLAAIILRIYDIGALWLNEDEAYTMTAAKRLITGTGTPNDASPVFIGLQYLFFLAFGINETAGRIISVIFSILTLITLYLFVKKYINIQTAVFVIVLLSFSFFNVFMSRLGRPYTALQFFYLVLIWFFLKINSIFDNSNISFKDSLKKIIFNRNSMFLLLILIISLKIHPWTSLIIIAFLFYFVINTIYFLIKKNYTLEYKYNLFLFIFVFVLILTILIIVNLNLFPNLFKGMQVDAFGIDIKRSIDFLKDNPFKGILHYLKLIYYDYNFLWFFAIIGFISSFLIIKNTRILFLIHSVFLSHIIVLGFFINVLQQRYIFPAYSFYFIYVALGFYTIYSFCINLINLKNNKIISYSLLSLFILTTLLAIPYSKYRNLYSLNMFNNIYIDKIIGEYTFYPYRNACIYVREQLEPHETVVSLMPRIAEFYIDKDIFTLRQVRFNREKLNTADELIRDTTLYPNSMQNHKSFLNFLKEHKSGWLIADTRINTVLSNETKNFILGHFDFHILGSNPLSTMLVGHWDSTTLYKRPRYFWALHEYADNNFLPYPINTDPNSLIKLTIIYSGVEKEDEATTSIGKLTSNIPPNRKLGVPDTGDWIMKADELVKSQGINFIYNKYCGDSIKGYMIHDIITLLPRRN